MQTIHQSITDYSLSKGVPLVESSVQKVSSVEPQLVLPNNICTIYYGLFQIVQLRWSTLKEITRMCTKKRLNEHYFLMSKKVVH